MIDKGWAHFSHGADIGVRGVGNSKEEAFEQQLADTLFKKVPAGVGSRGRLHLTPAEMDSMLAGGAQWAVEAGYGRQEDLERTEDAGA